MRKLPVFVGLLMVLISIASCGPSTEEIATLTAAEWTETPLPTYTPTPTATPIPYDLEISLNDANGNSLPGASIFIPGTGNYEPAFDEQTGKYSWSNLPYSQGTLDISLQGYSTLDFPVTLERGTNYLTIVLERDPLQILSSEACQPGQETLYFEDFEDLQAQDWNTSGTSFVYAHSKDHGTFLKISTGEEFEFIDYSKTFQGNIVWIFDLAFSSQATRLWIEPRLAPQGIYYVFFEQGGVGIQKEIEQDVSDIANRVRIPFITENDWRKVAIALFDGSIDVWLDGKLVIAGNDAEALENGTLAIETEDNEAPINFDNMVVCSLSEPYIPPITDEEAAN